MNTIIRGWGTLGVVICTAAVAYWTGNGNMAAAVACFGLLVVWGSS